MAGLDLLFEVKVLLLKLVLQPLDFGQRPEQFRLRLLWLGDVFRRAHQPAPAAFQRQWLKAESECAGKAVSAQHFAFGVRYGQAVDQGELNYFGESDYVV